MKLSQVTVLDVARMIGAVLALLLSSAIPNAFATPPADADCLPKLRSALVAGGFTGPTDCSLAELSAKHIGSIHSGSSSFDVYDYRYRTKPEPGLVPHGGQKIIVLRDGKYLGHYALSTPPYQEISIEQNSVRIKVPADVGNTFTFSELGPPSRAWLNGENLDLSK